jgi:hypothetical protein
MGWVTNETYPKKGMGVSHPPGGVYPTLHHMDGLVKQLELQVYGYESPQTWTPRLNMNCSAWSNESNDQTKR